MVVKSSENENKGFTMNVRKPKKSGRDQLKDHESGRDEVASVGMDTFSTYPANLSFFLVSF